MKPIIILLLPLVILLTACSSLGRDKTPLMPAGFHLPETARENTVVDLGRENKLFVEELSNGLTILVLEMPYATVSHGIIALQVGGRYEPDDYAGISHLLEHMLFKEKEDFKPLTKIRESGGSVNAVTDFELTTYYFTVLPERFSEAMEALAKMVLEPHFDQEDLDTEREVVLEELAMNINDPRAAVLPPLIKKVFPESPLANLVIGNKKSVKNITLHDLDRFYSAYYTPDNMAVAVAGRIKAEDTVQQLKSIFEKQPRRPIPRHSFAVPEIAVHKLTKKIPINQSFYIVGAVVPGRGSDDFHSMEVLDVLLGSGINSRLYRRIVMDEGITDELYPYWFSLSDTGVWAVFLSVNPEDLEKTSSIINEEFRAIREGRFTEDELLNAKKALIARSLLNLDRPEDIARFELENVLFKNRAWSVDEYIETLRGVSKADVVAIADRYLASLNIVSIELEPARGPSRWWLILKYLTTKKL